MTSADEARLLAFAEKLGDLLDAEDNPDGLLDGMLGYAVGRMLVEGSTTEQIRVLFDTTLATLASQAAALAPGGSA